MSGGAESIDRFSINLPLGFRFHPSDEELVRRLKWKIEGKDPDMDIIREVDVCKLEPWDLPAIKTDDKVWFFFSPPDYKYSKGYRSNRATKAGYWKPTGRDSVIESENNKEVIGCRKTLTFYKGKSPTGIRTNWAIHEFHAEVADLPAHAYVLCRLWEKKIKNKKKKEKKKEKKEKEEEEEKEKKGSDVSSPGKGASDTGFHQNDLANTTAFTAGPSRHSSDIASDIGNPQVEEMTSYDLAYLDGILNDIAFTPPDPHWLSDIEKEPLLDPLSPGSFNISHESIQSPDWDAAKFADSLIADPDEHHGSVGGYGKDGESSTNTSIQLPQYFYLEGEEDWADYVSVTDLLQNKNPIKESKKDSVSTQNPNATSMLNSTWNELVGMNQRGSFGFPETASASLESSSLPGIDQPVITKKNHSGKMHQENYAYFFNQPASHNQKKKFMHEDVSRAACAGNAPEGTFQSVPWPAHCDPFS